MSNHVREREFWAIARAVLDDALSRGILSSHGEALRGDFSTVLRGHVPAKVTVSFLPPRPAGDLPPEAYLRWTLWPDETGPRPRGYSSVMFDLDRGWNFYGDDDYCRVVARSADLKPLLDYASSSAC